MTLRDHLPTDGPMGSLYRKRRLLYYALLIVGGGAFVGVALVTAYALALLPLLGAQALQAVLAGDAVLAWLWLLVIATVGVVVVATAYLVGRVVGEYTRGDD